MSASEAPNGTGLSIVGDQALRKITAIVRTSARPRSRPSSGGCTSCMSRVSV
jgi:hypothetical protein